MQCVAHITITINTAKTYIQKCNAFQMIKYSVTGPKYVVCTNMGQPAREYWCRVHVHVHACTLYVAVS